MPADYHYWTCILRNGEVLKGVDDYPTLADKLNTKTLILSTQEGIPFEIEVPEGYGLIWKRRVTFTVGPDGRQDTWKYLISFEKLEQERSESVKNDKT